MQNKKTYHIINITNNYYKKLNMTNLKTLKSNIPDYASDIRNNISNLINEKNSVLSPKQVFGAALAAAYAAKEKSAINDIKSEAKFHLSRQEMESVKTAAAVTTMENIYRNFVKATNDPDYGDLPNKLTTENANNHNIDKIDFEIFALATCIINTCEKSINLHVKTLIDYGLSKEQVQMIAKIVATMGAAAQILKIEEII